MCTLVCLLSPFLRTFLFRCFFPTAISSPRLFRVLLRFGPVVSDLYTYKRIIASGGGGGGGGAAVSAGATVAPPTAGSLAAAGKPKSS
jgi:hypothetical protein